LPRNHPVPLPPCGLVTPQQNTPLREVPLQTAESLLGGRPLKPLAREGPSPIGPTPTVLLSSPASTAYPIVDGVPILAAPEVLVPEGRPCSVRIDDPKYAESYRETDHYTQVAAGHLAAVKESTSFRELRPSLAPTQRDTASFPYPIAKWIGPTAVCTSVARAEAYRHLVPLHEAHVLEVGGSGINAVRMLLAGAQTACLVTPVLHEALLAKALAELANITSRLYPVVGIAEELPFPDASFTAAFSAGTIHHTITSLSFAEASRVLGEGGRFSAVEPWRAPLYGLGTCLLGKNHRDKVGIRRGSSDASVFCRPLTEGRLNGLDAFPRYRVCHHGALTRYPILGIEKFGCRLNLRQAWWLLKVDDYVSSLIPGLRARGSCVTLLAST
jgi:SAM-dependent methyltransferase/uncharacterized protein YbaR (Trm112 family)